jgi:tRNA-specific 2-thiouridylase
MLLLAAQNQCKMLLRQLSSFFTPAEFELVRSALPPASSKIVVGMSGGVDSSVSALLLRAFQHDNVQGVWMSNWSNEDGRVCEEDFADAQDVCRRLDIPLSRLDLRKEYWNKVWQPCLEAFEAGQTPNPDVWCNREIKFGAFAHVARERFGADVVATGHYARRSASGHLCRAVHIGKDQSYFLSMVDSLQAACFPVGGLRKSRVRELAQLARLGRVASKPDSVGVCFVGKQRARTFGSFLEEFLPNPRGQFRHAGSGSALGAHGGVLGFTPGQRARIAGQREALYVVSKDLASGTVWVAPGEKNPLLYTQSIAVSRLKLRVQPRPSAAFVARAQTGSREADVLCTVRMQGEDAGVVELQSAVRTPAPGQVVALYSPEDGLECWGGGVVVDGGALRGAAAGAFFTQLLHSQGEQTRGA